MFFFAKQLHFLKFSLDFKQKGVIATFLLACHPLDPFFRVWGIFKKYSSVFLVERIKRRK